MKHKKYAPLIGKELTWDIIDGLMKDMRAQIIAEDLKPKRVRHRSNKGGNKNKAVHMEDDGS